MATVTATLTLVSTDATTDALSLTVSSALTTTSPSINVARVSLVGDASASDILTTANSW